MKRNEQTFLRLLWLVAILVTQTTRADYHFYENIKSVQYGLNPNLFKMLQSCGAEPEMITGLESEAEASGGLSKALVEKSLRSGGYYGESVLDCLEIKVADYLELRANK